MAEGSGHPELPGTAPITVEGSGQNITPREPSTISPGAANKIDKSFMSSLKRSASRLLGRESGMGLDEDKPLDPAFTQQFQDRAIEGARDSAAKIIANREVPNPTPDDVSQVKAELEEKHS